MTRRFDTPATAGWIVPVTIAMEIIAAVMVHFLR